MLKIFIDADGCPVKEETYKVAARYQLEVFVVANKRIHIPFHPLVKQIVASDSADAADDEIVSLIEENDICITSDIPLADRCLKKNAYVLGTRGEEFDEDMIGEALATRDLLKQLREGGQNFGGPTAFENSHRSKFLGSLDRIIQKIKNKRK